jgi:hypothetical protein
MTSHIRSKFTFGVERIFVLTKLLLAICHATDKPVNGIIPSFIIILNISQKSSGIVVLGCSLLELIQIHVSKVAVRIIKISIFLLIFMASSYFAGAVIILIPNRKVFIILLIHVVSNRGYAYNLKTIRIKIDFQTFLIRKRSLNNTVITYTHLNFLSIIFVSYHKMYAFFCINVFCWWIPNYFW